VDEVVFSKAMAHLSLAPRQATASLARRTTGLAPRATSPPPGRARRRSALLDSGDRKERYVDTLGSLAEPTARCG
jgi:hypothetical protein